MGMAVFGVEKNIKDILQLRCPVQGELEFLHPAVENRHHKDGEQGNDHAAE